MRRLFCYFILLYSFSLYAQESKVSINYKGKDFTQLKHAWTAQWITHPTESTLDARMFLFRKQLELAIVPEKFIIYLSADNRYRLYINEKYIISGPSASDINHYRYETLDISKYLNIGKNTIAVEVVNFGEYRKGGTMSFQTAFILQGHENNPININTGKSNGWKVYNNTAFSIIPFVSDSLNGYYVAGPGEKINSELQPWGWKKQQYDDTSWSQPKLGTVEFAVGRGFLFGSTWHLVPRVIPFMEERIQRFDKIARSKGIKPSEAFINGKGNLTIPANSKVEILLDQSHHTIGHPSILFSNGRSSQIKITYAEAMYQQDGTKGNRNVVSNKKILGYYDLIYPDGGKNRTVKAIGQKTYRYVQLDINTSDAPLIIHDFYGNYTAYPFKENARFITSNDTLSKIWDAAWLTLRNSAVENFIDPYYEQMQYIGDARIEALVSISVDGDDRLMRKAIEMFDNSRLPMGLTQSRYPSYIVQVIPTYSLLWINMLYDHHIYKKDDAFLEKYIPGVKSVLDWWIRKIDTTNMPTKMEWWNFTDWSSGFHNGIPDGADDGYSTSIALQLMKTLQYATILMQDLGKPELATKYKRIEKSILKSVLEKCYVKQRNLFSETPNKLRFSQHTNILAILTDAIPENVQKNMMEKILKDTSLIQTTLYYKFYLFEALNKVGLGNQYTSLLSSWTNQLDLGLTTFAETDVDPRSECHAWSASPNFHFLKIIAGVSPGSKHFKEVKIAPNFNNLDEFDVQMPHPNGMIIIHLKKKKNGKLSGEITLPSNTKGVLIWQGRRVLLKSGLVKIG